jgi:outer membrane protein
MKRTSRRIASLALAGVVWLSTDAAAQPVLTADDAVKLALQRNSQIINASADVLSARGGVYGAYSGVLPHVSVGYSRDGSWTNDSKGTDLLAGRTLASNIIEAQSYATTPSLSAQWAVLDPSALSGLRAARTGLKSAEWQRSATRNDVVLEARRQFYEVVKTARLVGVSTNAVQLARDNERRVRVLFEVGSVSRSDLLRAQVSTSQAELDSIISVQALLVQRGGLASYIGIEESKLGDVDTSLAVTIRAFDEATVLREAVQNRPDLRATVLAVKSAKSSLASARLGYLPALTLAGSRTFNAKSNNSSRGESEDLLTGLMEPSDRAGSRTTNSQLSAQVALRWAVFDGLATGSRIASAQARLLRAEASRDVLSRNLAAEVHEALLTYQQVLAGEAVARRSMDSATENLKLTQQKYNVGSATILELVDAQVQLQRAESQLVSALAAIRVAEARVERVRGRGV